MPEQRMLLVEPADMLRRTVSLTARLRGRDVRRVILKPFRAKVLLETLAAMGSAPPH